MCCKLSTRRNRLLPMRQKKLYWCSIRRSLLCFTATGLPFLVLVYLIQSHHFSTEHYVDSKMKDQLADQAFRYPHMLFGKYKEYYINETHIPLIPDEAIQSLSESDMLKVEKRMERRHKFLTEKCSLGLDFVVKPNTWHFLVNTKYHIIWCNVFKAAASSWMYNFDILAGYTPEFLNKTETTYVELAHNRYVKHTLAQLRNAQTNSVTFIIVRHPFERFVSAYRDKFIYAEPYSMHDYLGQDIVRKYRQKSLQNKPPKYPTFPEFVNWFLHQSSQTKLKVDMHFMRYTEFCTACLVNFDLILKFETLQEDQMYLIEKAGLKHIIAPQWQNMGKGNNTLDLLQSLYSKLSRAELDGLYNYYKYDFELFNYSATSYFDLVESNGVEGEDDL